MLLFARWPGTATAHTSKFVGIQLKKKEKHLRDVDVSQTSVLSEIKLILARIGLFGDYEGRDFTMYLKYRAQLGTNWHSLKHLRVSLGFSKLIVEAVGYQQRAQTSERGSSRELYPIRHRRNKKARYSR
ncbi:unnamed protein product [Pocillopora meandrina]|uniref:Uncharacterized protein n=1 Tax=Pocillopora meandrina TaxID=46732 RepID=A0AAU9XUI0_9CNID|nr:unnamed protein product [Pocillopora meandrina]